MRRVALLGGVVVLASAVGFGQPPMPPAPPATLPPAVTGSQPIVPAAGTAAPRTSPDTPLSKFEPLVAFPPPTQLAVRAVLLGSGWMTRMNQPQGRFQFGYLPAVRQPMDGDNDLLQARAALALAQAARFTGDDRQAAVASQAVLTLLAATRIDPNDPNSRVPVHAGFSCNRVGFAATLVLAVCELPGADEKLLAEAERLCEFLRKHLRADGSVHYTDGPTDVPPQVDPAGLNEHPGTVLHAVALANRARPATWRLEAVKKGLEHYRGVFKAAPHPMLAATLTPAFTEFYLQTQHADAAAAVFEMNDWLVGLQYQPTDPRFPTWAGGFRTWANGKPADGAPGFETGAYVQSLAGACLLTRHAVDLPRFNTYKQAVTDAVQFLTGLQYSELNTRHFENTFRAGTLIGGFHLAPTDGNLRIDATAWAVTGLLRFLQCGAERN